MVQKSLYAAVALAACLFATSDARAQAVTGTTPPPAANFYVMGGDGLAAAMYTSPRPVPPLVGHTYITYEPLAPHEFLYQHHRSYVRKHPDGTRTRTRVTWGHHMEFGPSMMWSMPALRSPTGNSFEGVRRCTGLENTVRERIGL